MSNVAQNNHERPSDPPPPSGRVTKEDFEARVARVFRSRHGGTAASVLARAIEMQSWLVLAAEHPDSESSETTISELLMVQELMQLVHEEIQQETHARPQSARAPSREVVEPVVHLIDEAVRLADSLVGRSIAMLADSGSLEFKPSTEAQRDILEISGLGGRLRCALLGARCEVGGGSDVSTLDAAAEE